MILTRPVTAICDNCGKITDVVFKEQRHANDIRETYFKCEHCFYHYTSFVTDSKVRKMQHKRDSMTGDHNSDKRLKLHEQVKERMAILKYNLINYGRADI